ncbi:PorT family protein [Flavihumibacter rivuli]|uniref:outer membrane beta-barrel protein n=1 Tax=Flavihumibacter rivuli TaxID=2838156 RepID=UPI001BDE89C1|nr:outer membrane beta-barrel protein [Flavihumibacter rivuli]ULQ55949.1 PorT family protein [Flavihumibacter rivuli]
MRLFYNLFLFSLLVISSLTTVAQESDRSFGRRIGIIGGYNFVGITKADQLNTSNTNGFLVGGFLAPGGRGSIGYRTEVLFSRQGYNYTSGATDGKVQLDYLILPQFMNIRITKFLNLQVGTQVNFLLSSKANDSTKTTGVDGVVNKVNEYYNKYGISMAGGVEVYPFKGLIIGGRFTANITPINASSFTGTIPDFIPSSEKLKNNLVQLYAGYRF